MRERSPGVWEIRVYLGRDPVTKRPRQLSRTVRAGRPTATGKPPKAVREAAARFAIEAADIKPDATNATLSFLLDRHFEMLERNGRSPQTLHGYRTYAKLHINPALGSKPVRALTAYDLDAFYGTLGAGGKGAATIRQAHAIISGALKQGVKWGWLETNAAKSASPPSLNGAQIVAPTATEVQRLLRAADDRDPVLAAVLLLGALTGARRGELCALRWTDVDFTAGTLRIARSILDLPGRVEEKSTKSRVVRTIGLGAAGVEALRLHRAQVLERARIGEVTVPPDAFVFSDRLDCRTPIRPDKATRFFTRLRDDLGLPHVHLHSLRHFQATQLVGSGVDVRTAAGRLGHADASVTLRTYSSFLPATDAAAADFIGELLGR